MNEESKCPVTEDRQSWSAVDGLSVRDGGPTS